MIFMVQVCLSPTTQEVGAADKTKCRLSAQPLATYIRLLGKGTLQLGTCTPQNYTHMLYTILRHPTPNPPPHFLGLVKNLVSTQHHSVCVCCVRVHSHSVYLNTNVCAYL